MYSPDLVSLSSSPKMLCLLGHLMMSKLKESFRDVLRAVEEKL